MEQHDDGKTMIIELKKDDNKNKEDDVTLTHSSLFPVKSKKSSFLLNPVFLASVCLLILVIAVCLLMSNIGKNNTKPSETTQNGETHTTTEPLPPPPVIPTGAVHVTGLSEATLVGSNISSKFALLVEADSLKAVASKNANERMYPASLTKIMTFLVAYDKLSNNLDKQLRLTEEIRNTYPEGSRAWIDVGDILTVEQCMYAMLLKSDTDAVLMLALAAAGSEQAFVDLMNEKAKELGLTETHFTGANGLHDKNHYTTPAEMAVIFAEALKNELFHTIITTDTYVTYLGYYKNGNYATYRFTFKNSTLTERFDGKTASAELTRGGKIIGGKTGFTDEAKFCQAALATDASGKEYIAILGYANSSDTSAKDTVALYNNYMK